jgi:hypothetical protein
LAQTDSVLLFLCPQHLSPQPLSLSFHYLRFSKKAVSSTATLASIPFRNPHGQFILCPVSLPPSSPLSTESSLALTPFSSPIQPHHTLDNTPPTSPTQPPSITHPQIQPPRNPLHTSDDEEDMPNDEDFFFYRNGHAVMGMDTLTDIQPLQPHSLFSILFTIVYFFHSSTLYHHKSTSTLLFHNRKRSSVLE